MQKITTNMQQTTDLDFDFQMPCRYFKSSFARSLSLNNNNNNNNNALTLPKKPQTNEAKQQQQQQPQQQLENQESLERDSEQDSHSPCATPPPALPARRHTANMIHFGAANQLLSPPPPNHPPPHPPHTPQHPQPPTQSARNLNLVWPMQPTHQQPPTQQQDANILAAPSHHIYDLPQQLHHHHHQHQQQQQQQQQQHHHQQQQQQQHQLNVEAVILQNQVDTLHWQLKQTETNCEMYRAVMEEVARFFERYQLQQQLQQTHRNGEQIARSKSLHHVHGVGNTSLQSDSRDDDASSAGSASYLRARSSTNLILNKSMHAMNEEHNYETIAPAGSYNAFKDFTWRRSPKKSGGSGGCKARLSSPEASEEKLNQEAFRLARTIRNLLHTSEQQPDLTQPRHSLASIASLPSGNHRLCKGKTSSVMTLLTPPLHNSTSIMNATLEAPSPAAKSNAELIFLRANNMRDSRLSLRSSTDSSVHSTISSTASSSSKVETDEETPSNGNHNNTTTTASSNTAISNSNTKPTSGKQSGSSTEDESGFSSISSFHDVGLPLSSTLMNQNQSQRRQSMSSDSRNSTLKSGLNMVGLPLQTQTQIQVQVQAQISTSPSPSKTYRNANRYQRFSTLSNEDAAAVLWV
ncbi:LOW QUALITY PROTEIN: transcription factor mef2A [Drosophila ficusphila]|uniref:LOW QUALITY PROTEIN: transcription factor mef2A n=1 Tax=Drosophila ficusphila TaxID=30025 RepID=UPI001C891EBB|nr:LOW QUALITY PROTEIN: transcription factor mef2A [Drosophila ficusphila]